MRIDLFKQALEEKRAVKVIAGIDNFDIEKVINGDSEFQDYSQDKSIVYDWLKENA